MDVWVYLTFFTKLIVLSSPVAIAPDVIEPFIVLHRVLVCELCLFSASQIPLVFFHRLRMEAREE